MFHISTQRLILGSHSSSEIPILHSSVLTSQVRNPLYTQFSLLKSETQCTLHMYTLCSHFSSKKPIVHYCTLHALHWNALPYIGKFDGQAAFGIYGLAATYGHKNITQALQPCCFEHKYNTYTIQCGYGCSTVTANLQLWSIYGYGQSTVAATLFCYYGLSAHYSYSYTIFRLYALSDCNFSSIVYLQ